MTPNLRFSLGEDRRVIDRLNPRNNGKGWCHEGDQEDDMRLRELLLWTRLGELIQDLIVNHNPAETGPTGETYQPCCEERFSIWSALYRAIMASHLNTFNVARSFTHKFDGNVNRKKIGMQDYTSLALFADDVERLLRDLYGDYDQQVIDRLREAVLAIVAEFTKHLRKDLWEERQSAQNIDYVFGIGLPEGYGISGSDHRRMLRAVRDLIERARIVRADSTKFSKYTVSFVNDLYENWRPLSQPTEAENGSDPF
jgi:hypothetical protein